MHKILKSTFVCLSLSILMTVIFGCSRQGVNQKHLLISNWVLTYAAHASDNTPAVDLNSALPNVQIQFEKKGVFSIIHAQTGEPARWDGTYQEAERADDGTILLELTFQDGTAAQAVYGIKESADSSKTPSLTLRTEKYTLSFTAEKPS